MARTRGTPKSAEDRDRFLEAFAQLGTVVAACAATNIGRRTVYTWRDDDPDFAARWREAEEDATQNLEAEAVRRATSGSDVLLIFLLKARRPAVYRERRDLDLTVYMPRDEAERSVDRLLSAARAALTPDAFDALLAALDDDAPDPDA